MRYPLLSFTGHCGESEVKIKKNVSSAILKRLQDESERLMALLFKMLSFIVTVLRTQVILLTCERVN